MKKKKKKKNTNHKVTLKHVMSLGVALTYFDIFNYGNTICWENKWQTQNTIQPFSH